MVLWVFQLIFNIASVAFVFYLLVELRRLRDSDTKNEKQVGPLVASTPQQASTPVSINAAQGTLTEKTIERLGPISSSQGTAYELAQDMIAKGDDLRKVSVKTGLSFSELQLIGKISQKNH